MSIPGPGPPVRPMCGADEAKYTLLSQMLKGIRTAVTKIVDKKIISTENPNTYVSRLFRSIKPFSC